MNVLLPSSIFEIISSRRTLSNLRFEAEKNDVAARVQAVDLFEYVFRIASKHAHQLQFCGGRHRRRIRLPKKGTPEEVVAELQSKGFKTVVNLTEHAHPAATAMRAAGISAIHLPIDNFKAADDAMTMLATTLFGAEGCEKQWPVLMHCKGGVGRTGTMLAVAVHQLNRQGKITPPVVDCVAHVRSIRKGSLEVDEQVTAFNRWAQAHP